jgi:hypothetical protein
MVAFDERGSRTMGRRESERNRTHNSLAGWWIQSASPYRAPETAPGSDATCGYDTACGYDAALCDETASGYAAASGSETTTTSTEAQGETQSTESGPTG